MNTITVRKERLARCNYSVTVIKQGQQVWHQELSGGAGKIIGSDEVMSKIPAEFRVC